VRRVLRILRSPWVQGAFAAAGAPAAATRIALSFHGGDASAVSIYILAVVAATAVGGLWTGLASAVLSFLGLNFFFTPPQHTFRVSKG
jgi:two-component system sensor histidine kinase KdpD